MRSLGSVARFRPAALALALVLTVGTSSDAAAPNTPGLSVEYLDAIAITVPTSISAVDQTSSARAVLTAQQLIHRSDAPLSVFAGRGSRFADDPAVDVIVVVFAGGEQGPIPPAQVNGNLPGQPMIEYSGVIIDRNSGAVLRWFTLGHV